VANAVEHINHMKRNKLRN